MRSALELLKVLRKELHGDLFESGLCLLCYDMYLIGTITFNERRCLDFLIIRNKPLKTHTGFYFPIGKIEPRDKFLQELIKKYE